MERNNYEEIFENIGGFVLKVSEGMAKVVKGINVALESDTWKAFIEFIRNIPDDVKDTKLFKEVQQLQKINLHYEDVIWLVKNFGLENIEENWRKPLESNNIKSDLYQYIRKIILSDSMEKREKLIVLLAHMELLFYDTLSISKNVNSKLKDDIKEISIKKMKA